ncbi:MAG: hypothetical protein Kow0037_01250 [Calditrichia bacterium]
MPVLLALHLVLLCINTLIILVRFNTPVGKFLRNWYPVFFLPLFFTEMHYLVPIINNRIYDLKLIQFDKFITWGCQVIDLPLKNEAWLSILQLGYVSYYFLPILLLSFLYKKGKMQAFDDAGAGILMMFYFSYIGYVLVPAIGPRYFLTHLENPLVGQNTIFLWVNHMLNFLENIQWDAFPSGHVAIAGGVCYYSHKFFRPLFPIMLLFFMFILLSTVWLRYHYFIDLVAGIALILIVVNLNNGLSKFFAVAATRD